MDIQKEREAFELSFKSTQIYCRECAIRGKDILEFSKTVNGYFNIVTNDAWNMWLDAKAQAVPAKLVLELEKGRFKEYEFKALLRQALRASKVTRSKLNWVHVMGMLGTGSTVAHRICEALGVNPDGTEFKAQEQK